MDQIVKSLFPWVKEAGLKAKFLRENLSSMSISKKTPRDLVTEVDIEVDQFLAAKIKNSFPAHAILSEESAPVLEQQKLCGPLWIIDPIDGTHNFARGHFQSAVSVAFADRGQVIHGAVYNPFTEEFFQASKGAGALLNGKKITCSEVAQLGDALVGVGRPFSIEANAVFTAQVGKILDSCFDLRRIGSGALDICWVACGKLDCFFETLNTWDIAAAALIAREAGCCTGHYEDLAKSNLPEDFDAQSFLVSNPLIYREMQDLLKS